MTILNLTQHTATAEQLAAGVIDLPAEARAFLADLLTVSDIPTTDEIRQRCESIAALAASLAAPEDREDGTRGFALFAMIGGAPFLMATLERALIEQGIKPLYAFSRRESVEVAQPDGSVRKEGVFRHLGFVEAI